MAVRPTDPEALHLFQLIGAPLLALVQAEAQAAQTSADFIRRVGFDARETEAPAAAGSTPAAPPVATATVRTTDAVAPLAAVPAARDPTAEEQPSAPQLTASPADDDDSAALQAGGDLGDLRIAEFRFDRYAPDGTPRPHVARVPVLSLFPIPLLQIKEAEVDFGIRIVSRIAMADGQKSSSADTRLKPDFLALQRVELKGFLSGVNGTTSGQAVTQANIRVRVRMQQSDLPAGLTKLLAMMTDGTAATPVPSNTAKQPT